MKTIWKYKLEITDRQSIQLPDGAKILTAQMQGGELCLWALVRPDEIKRAREILIFGTGHPIDGSRKNYIATAQDGAMVWHVFEAT